MAMYSDRTAVGISSYSFMICSSTPNAIVFGNDSHLPFVIFQCLSHGNYHANKECVFMLGNVLSFYPKSAKHIIDIRGMSVFECPGDSLDLKPIQED